MDKVGDKLKAGRGVWNFKDIDHNKFENHISKSVPGYLGLLNSEKSPHKSSYVK